MATYNLRDDNGRFKCVPEYPRKRKTKCGCALGGSHPCPIHRPSPRLARHAQAPTRRSYLDEQDLREYQDHFLELEAEVTGLNEQIGHIQDEVARDRYDQGRAVDYRHFHKGRKAFTPTGRRVRAPGAIEGGGGYRDQLTDAQNRVRAAKARLRDVKDELAEVNGILRRGYIDRPASFYAGAARTRPPLVITRRNQRSRYTRR